MDPSPALPNTVGNGPSPLAPGQAEDAIFLPSLGVTNDSEFATRLIQENLTVVDSELALHPDIPRNSLSEINMDKFRSDSYRRLRQVFLRVNNMEIWNHVAQETTREMENKVLRGEVSGQLAMRYYKIPVEAKEILAFLALRIVFRGRRNFTSVPHQFQVLPENLERWPMAEKRFQAISSCLRCDWAVFPGLLRNSWQDIIKGGGAFCVDEAIYAFHSRADESSPQRYIPRKPHPNGLLTYFAALKLPTGPYLFDLEPDYEITALNPRVAMERIVQRWPWSPRPHVVVDAAFSGQFPLQVVKDMGGFLTGSFNVAHKRWLFEGLKKFCPRGKWLAVKDKEGTVWSLLRSAEADAAEHFLITSAFACRDAVPVTGTSPLEASQVASLVKIGLRGLTAMAISLGVEISGDEHTLAKNIARKVNGASIPTSTSSPVDLSPDSSSPASSSATLAAPAAPASLTSSAVTSVNTTDLFQQLMAKSVPELKAMAKEKALRPKKLKKDLVEDLVRAAELGEGEIRVILETLGKSAFSSSPPQHNFYRANFNGVDLHDRYWNRLQDQHSMKGWQAKFTFGLLQSGLINSWVCYRQFEEVTLDRYADRLASSLLHYFFS